MLLGPKRVQVFIVHTKSIGVKPNWLAFDIICVYNVGMKKRGRPPKLPEERLEYRLDLRVSESEKTAFKLAAANSDQELSVWIRIQLHHAVSQESAQAPRVRRNRVKQALKKA